MTTKTNKAHRTNLKNKKRKIKNLAKHAEKFKDNPDYWKKAKELTGSKNISYGGKTY